MGVAIGEGVTWHMDNYMKTVGLCREVDCPPGASKALQAHAVIGVFVKAPIEPNSGKYDPPQYIMAVFHGCMGVTFWP
jgi:hypothetical protein